MKHSTDVVFALTGDVRRNSRALKQLRLLGDLGLTVTVLSYGPPSEQAPLHLPGVNVRVLPRPSCSGPRFFWRVHQQFAHEGTGLPARVYHASDLYTLPAMQHCAAQHKGQLAYDARELYAHVAATVNRPWVRATWKFVERRHIGKAAAVFTVSDSIADHLAQSCQIPRPVILHNAPPVQVVKPGKDIRALAKCQSDVTVLLHQGSIQKDRGCKLLADAMQYVHGAVLIFLGNGPLKPALQDYAQANNLSHCVRFVDAVSPDQLLPVTATADVGIALLEDTCLNHRYALPNKLFEYLMAGLPVLTSELPEMARIVREYNVGRTICPSDAIGLRSALQEMVDDVAARQSWAANAPLVFGTFNWEIASDRFIRAYRQLLH